MISASPIRVLIVDDSALVRKMLSAALASEQDITVVGTAPNAFIARDKIVALKPDVITLDIEMPGMDGITFLKKLMSYRPMPVIVISSLGHAACQASLEALRAGAVEILAKPNGPYSVGELGHTLAAKIRIAAASHVRVPGAAALQTPPPSRCAALPSDGPTAAPATSVASLPRAARHLPHCRVIAIGASTGGPGALAEILRPLPPDTPPILIVQHMPPVFTRHLAERLDRECQIAVKEAEDGDDLLPGRALIAPGNFHMMLKSTPRGDRVSVREGPPVCFSRPSVDVLFASVAEAAGAQAVAILLTGMGADGARSMLQMRRAGAATFAQDENSCVVFGMPREAILLGAVDTVLPLGDIAAAVLRRLAVPPVAKQVEPATPERSSPQRSSPQTKGTPAHASLPSSR